MSRIGEKPIDIPSGVTVTASGADIAVKGPKGELGLTLPPGIEACVEGACVNVARVDDTKQSKSFHGLGRSLIANMVTGVSEGYTKELEISGVGFKAAIAGNTLSLSLGFASPKEYTVCDGVTVTVNGGTNLVVSGADKQKVGETAARIRAYFPAEPYKGKGIMYKGERVRRKVGKTVA